MDTDIWDMKYIIAIFKSLFLTFIILVAFLLFNLFYHYIRFGIFKINLFVSDLLFYSNITILFLLISLFFVTNAMNDFK